MGYNPNSAAESRWCAFNVGFHPMGRNCLSAYFSTKEAGGCGKQLKNLNHW